MPVQSLFARFILLPTQCSTACCTGRMAGHHASVVWITELISSSHANDASFLWADTREDQPSAILTG